MKIVKVVSTWVSPKNKRINQKRAEFWEEIEVIFALIGIGICIGVIAAVWVMR